MSEPAKLIKNATTDLSGLEDVFLASESSEPTSEAPATDSEVLGSSREVITTEEAAKRLGISARAVINRLKAGTLAGQRVQGKFRTEWRVFWDNNQECSEVPPEIIIGASESSEPSEESDAEADNKFGPVPNEALLAQVLQQNYQLMEQVNQLTYRNGWLESKLEERDTEIKLLTDRRAKRGRWARFASWFLGQDDQ